MILSPGGSTSVHAVIPPGTEGRHTLGTKGRHSPDQKQTPNTPPAPKVDTPGTKGRPPRTKSRHPPDQRQIPRTKSRHPPDQRQTPGPKADTPRTKGRRLLLRTVPILLECILVILSYYICMVALHLFVYVCMFFSSVCERYPIVFFSN